MVSEQRLLKDTQQLKRSPWQHNQLARAQIVSFIIQKFFCSAYKPVLFLPARKGGQKGN